MLRDTFRPQFPVQRSFADLAFGWAGKAGIIFLLILISAFHTITLFGSPWAMSQWAVFILMAAAPAIVSSAVIPGAWRRPGRWFLLLAAVFVSDPQYTYLAVIVVETWALYRTWVIEAGWRGAAQRAKTVVALVRSGSHKLKA